jgi:glutathione S-transferase
MGDIFLDKYPNVVAWIERIKKLPGVIDIPGLTDPMVRRKGKSVEQILSGK